MSRLEKWVPEAIALAQATGGFAKCTRRQVGAIIIDLDGNTISTGRNGAPPNARECTSGGCPRGASNYEQIAAHSDYNTPGPGFCVSSHAEDNAITRAGLRAEGALLAITARPCPSCIKRAAGAKVALVAWPDMHGHQLVSTPAELLAGLLYAARRTR